MTPTQKFIDFLRDSYTYENGQLMQVSNLKPIGWYDKGCGYIRVRIKGKAYLLHRLIFLYHHGYLPEFVDHEDQNKLNNKIENLRACTYKGENASNSKRRTDNTSGHRGVTWHKATQKWMSSVYYKGKRYHIGVFEDKNEAAIEYNKLALKFFGEFAILNTIKENNI